MNKNNRSGLLEITSPVQQAMAGGGYPNGWNMINSTRPPPHHIRQPLIAPNNFLSPSTPSNHFITHPYHLPAPSGIPLSSTYWHDNNREEVPRPGGFVDGEEADKSPDDRCLDRHGNEVTADPCSGHHLYKQLNSATARSNFLYGHGRNKEFHISSEKAGWPQVNIMPPSSPQSVTSTFSSSTNMLHFPCPKADARYPLPDRPLECNSTAAGGAFKKARVQSSSSQSTFKARKEKLGDRITALHQLVSPYGKTDTASVLLEAIGYIRFLQNQIEALSLPYLSSRSNENLRQREGVQGEIKCAFPDDPGQLLDDNCIKQGNTLEAQDCYEVPKQDLRSRGLCLVPISCTLLQVGSGNGADYWSPPITLGEGSQ